MAVVVTIAKGYDLGYIWKTQDPSAEHATGGYYIDAAQAGEPPGRWWGPGAQALGLTPGQAVQRAPYDAVYRQIDPRTGAKLGRPRGRYPTFADHLARLQAAEPHATAERLIELEREAAQATRQPAAYYDVTVSFSKSISVLHASIRENERRARLGGDRQAAAYWGGREQAFQDALHRANRAALEYLQAWAGITRTGYHGTRIDGREPGRFEPAGLIVTSWLQGTSRDGDPQDHVHNQIARITRTFRDGKWRALDTMSVRAVLGALQAVAATTVECELTREFGVDWIPRADGRGNEIKRHHPGADGRVLHPHRAGAREGTRTRAGVGAQARPRADLARAAVHRQRRHPAITQGQGRGRDRLGRARAAVGRHARRRTGRDRAGGVGRARPGRASGRASRRPGAGRTARARGPGPGTGQGPSPGDQEQLAAVEGGGAMMLLADRLGYVQLAEPVRFTATWERAASLRLRHGDATALDEYDQHGRIRGAPPDHATDQAARAYLATYLTGRTVLLMAADWARCRELSARIRDDLIHLGLVDAGRTIRIADGAEASAGDLIICRANDHHLEAGEPGRALANGDILRIEAITRRGIMVRRLLDPDPATGQRRFTDRSFRYTGYQSADLAYAVTGHSAQGATVHTGIALVTGAEDRQWLYPAMTRGTDANLAYVFTTPARPADPQPGTRPAPELDRYDRTRRERAGFPATQPRIGSQPSRQPREPVAVLADVLSRDGAELSATETRRRNLANADHLAVLHAIWTAETQTPATTATASSSRPRCHPATAASSPTRPAGCTAPCTPPNSPAWTPPTSSAPPSPPGTWPDPVTSPPSSTPGSARASTRCSPSRTGPWISRVPQLPDPARQTYLPRSPP